MTQTAINYAKVLYDLGITEDIMDETKKLIDHNSEIAQMLQNPVIAFKDKEKVIDKVFPKQLHNFFKVLSHYQSVDCLGDIFIAYEEYVHEQKNVLDAVLYFVMPPSSEQLEGIKKKLAVDYKKAEVNIKLIEKPELIGGFLLQVGDKEIDYSILGRANRMRRQLLRR